MIQEKLSKGDLILIPEGASIIRMGELPYIYDGEVNKPELAIFDKELDEDHCEVVLSTGISKVVLYSQIYKPKGTEYGSKTKQKRQTTRQTAQE